MAGNEGSGGYPWQSLRDSTRFEVVRFDPSLASMRPFFGGMPGSPLYVPTPVFAQFRFERNGGVAYSPWISVTCPDMVIPRPLVANNVDVTLNYFSPFGIPVTADLINL